MNATQKKAKEKLRSSLAPNNEPGNYKQSLFKVVEVVDSKILKKKNRKKEWKYGYNSEYDFVCISNNGTLGEIYEIQGLKIGIPAIPNEIYSNSNNHSNQMWKHLGVPDFIRNIKSTVEFKTKFSEEIRSGWYDYIDTEFDRRDGGFWFMNNGKPTYVTGSHYMFLQWSKIDAETSSGWAEFRESNRLFHFFWEACKADPRSFGMIYLKNRRSGFSFMASSEVVNQATITRRSNYGILSKTGEDAKDMFIDKVVPIIHNYPFFFKPIQDGQEKPKSELSFQIPSKKMTRKAQLNTEDDDLLGEGLDSIIDWKSTGDNSYDGAKLKILVHDESAKWSKPNNILKNWRVTKTTLRLGRKITGKCMMGSTSNALNDGGQEYKDLYYGSDLRDIKRDGNGRTPTGMYALFVPMEWNFEGYIDKFGWPVFDTPEVPIEDSEGEFIDKGVLDHWKYEREGLANSPDAENEFLRQFPKTEEHAFRDVSDNSIFNLIRLNDQLDHNADLVRDGIVTRGSFLWTNGIQDTQVTFKPHKDGKFYVTYVLPPVMTNNIIYKSGIKCPGNEHMGSFGCDSYDIAGVVGGGGSNGALHGLSKFHMEDFPTNQFFLEYVARPQTAEMFFEDVLMAIVFYGMPILCENNKPGLLKYIARRGYRGFSINRPDKKYSNLNSNERELGGVPNSGPQMIQDHASAINSYIEHNVGKIDVDGNMGQMYFNRTLKDWAHFDITNRTRHDESISSGLAIMANQKFMYKPKVTRDRSTKVIMDMGQRKGIGGGRVFNNSIYDPKKRSDGYDGFGVDK